MPVSGVVTMLVGDGQYKGASFAGLVENVSDGGLCLVLDGGSLVRGTPVRIEFQEGLILNAWVCHCKNTPEGSHVGLSFDAIEMFPQTCSRPTAHV